MDNEDKKVLLGVKIHCTDMTVHELNSVPAKAETVYDIVRDVMKLGAYCYSGDVCYFIPPARIEKIEFIRGLPPEEEEEDEDNG